MGRIRDAHRFVWINSSHFCSKAKLEEQEFWIVDERIESQVTVGSFASVYQSTLIKLHCGCGENAHTPNGWICRISNYRYSDDRLFPSEQAALRSLLGRLEAIKKTYDTKIDKIKERLIIK
jgi:hypothetical protein